MQSYVDTEKEPNLIDYDSMHLSSSQNPNENQRIGIIAEEHDILTTESSPARRGLDVTATSSLPMQNQTTQINSEYLKPNTSSIESGKRVI